MAQQIEIRRDTYNNWSGVNPTLALGEIAYETDTKNLKVGDGSTAYLSLGYVNVSGYSGMAGAYSASGFSGYSGQSYTNIDGGSASTPSASYIPQNIDGGSSVPF